MSQGACGVNGVEAKLWGAVWSGIRASGESRQTAGRQAESMAVAELSDSRAEALGTL